ncbi:YceD family protein [Thalassiella azotivora]
MTALDPRSPLVLDTHELGRRPGSMRTLQRTVAAPEDLGTEVIGVPSGSDLELDLRLEAVMEGVLVSGTARARAVGECVRCLEDVEQPVDVTFQELFAYPGSRSQAQVSEDDEDVHELEGDLLDLEPVLRDAVVLALPFKPVCSEECPGLCPECGARLADDPGHQHESVDPRWAALQTLAAQERDQEES